MNSILYNLYLYYHNSFSIDSFVHITSNAADVVSVRHNHFISLLYLHLYRCTCTEDTYVMPNSTIKWLLLKSNFHMMFVLMTHICYHSKYHTKQKTHQFPFLSCSMIKPVIGFPMQATCIARLRGFRYHLHCIKGVITGSPLIYWSVWGVWI